MLHKIKTLLILVFAISGVLFLADCYPNKYPPVIESLEIIPATPTTDDNLTCAVQATDQDANLSTVEFEWSVNNLSVGSQTKSIGGSSAIAQDNLPSNRTNPGDSVKCELTIFDTDGQTATGSSSVDIRPNIPPTISGIPDITSQLAETIPAVDLWNYASDNEDPDSALTFSIEAQSDSKVINCFIEENRFVKSEASKSVGFSDVTVKVTDSGGLSNTDTFRITVEPPAYKLYGLNFSPYIDGQDPNLGSVVSEEQLRERMTIIAPFTEWIRTFGCQNGLELSGRIAHELGLKAAIGAWISWDKEFNEREIENLITVAQAGEADLVIVGNEVLLREDLSSDQLIEYINRVKAALSGIQVTTADVYGKLLSHPEVMDACDVILANCYPYWEGIHVDHAVAYLHARYQEIVARGNGKEVIVSETGWPSYGNQIGDAIPLLENACFYFLNFVSWARAESVDYFYFEAFDEQWKANYEGPQGAHWGVWDKYGNMKSCMKDVFDGQTIPDNWTCKEIPGGTGDPAIEFTYMPPYGSFEDLEGQVWHIHPEDYRVAVYIYVSGLGWWTKPYWDNPLTIIKCDGSWICDITTGGVDETATKIAAYLVPFGYNPPLANGDYTLPPELEQNAVAWIEITRSP